MPTVAMGNSDAPVPEKRMPKRKTRSASTMVTVPIAAAGCPLPRGAASGAGCDGRCGTPP